MSPKFFSSSFYKENLIFYILGGVLDPDPLQMEIEVGRQHWTVVIRTVRCT